MNSKQQIFKIACTPPDHTVGDDMGTILNSMGLHFYEFSIVDLENSRKMEQIDLLFINCPGPEPTWKSANNVRELVDNGGALYVSCYARKWIDFIFPDQIEFHSDGEIQNELIANVSDWQLKEFLGGIDQLILHYNTHWHGIKNITGNAEKIKKYMLGVRAGWFGEEPLLISFPYGEGFVIFTTFHNSQQVNALEHRILEFLVLKPLMSKVSSQTHTIMQRSNYVPMREYIGALSVSEESKRYEFYNRDYSNLKFVFNWQGNATTRIWIFDTKNNILLEENIRSCPFEYEVPAAAPGTWAFKMKIVDAPLKKFPYIIHVGKKDSVERQIEMDERTMVQSYSPQQKSSPQNDYYDFSPAEEHPKFSSPTITSSTPQSHILDLNAKVGSNLNPQNLFSNQNIKGKPSSKKYLKDCMYDSRYTFKTGLTVTIEILKPIRRVMGKFNLTFGKEIIIGKEYISLLLKKFLSIEPDLNDEICSITILNEQQIQIINLSTENVKACHFSGGNLDNLPSKNIEKEILYLPIVLFLGKKHEILLGLYV